MTDEGPSIATYIFGDYFAMIGRLTIQAMRDGLRDFKLLLGDHKGQTVQAIVTAIENRINIATFDPEPDPAELAMNDVGEIRLRTSRPLVFDGYASNRLTGSFILIEPGTNHTVCAGMLNPPNELVKPEYTDFAI